MYTDIQLEAIKIFGRKDLTEGCIITAVINGYSFDYHISGNGIFNGTKFAVIPRNFVCSISSWADTETQTICTDGCGDVKYEILGHIPHLEDLFRVAWSKGWEMSVSRGIKVWWLGDSEMNPSKKIPYNPTFQLLDQPNLSDIISLFR